MNTPNRWWLWGPFSKDDLNFGFWNPKRKGNNKFGDPPSQSLSGKGVSTTKKARTQKVLPMKKKYSNSIIFYWLFFIFRNIYLFNKHMNVQQMGNYTFLLCLFTLLFICNFQIEKSKRNLNAETGVCRTRKMMVKKYF